MMRFALSGTLFPLLAAAALAEGFGPDEAVRRMQLPDGFTVRCVASEPVIRQPVSMSFDDRGRLWVLQYLQYPTPAGLKPVKQDQYLRTIWDRVPEPPPHGPKGTDKLTILCDPDEHGVYRSTKDFVAGLNIASGFCLGRGGVYVVQPPYLLFYPDKDRDDVPDADPDVLLSGFGMDDTHSLANSLQWGPDGWLYGAAGSTSTSRIKNPANPAEVVEFQQGIWRYHPDTKVFELFSEGGGNTYGLDFDKNGQVIAGTNWGGFAMLHQMQGAYYVKGFAKHGPLHNPHAYGYLDHVPYTNFKGGHVTCGGIVYQADAFPPEYRDQYIAGNLLSNAVYWHKLEPNGSTFKARHGGDLLIANDTWFRPVDLIQGPDGSVYVADFYDRRAAHLDPVDNWDRTNGRIYKIEYKGTPKVPPFDLRTTTTPELVALLRHPNKWWRTEARRLLGERRDPAAYPALKKQVETGKGTDALEALWALYVSGGWSAADWSEWVAGHPNEHVRAWLIRLVGDRPEEPVPPAVQTDLLTMAAVARPVVAAQLACTARRLPAPLGLEIAGRLVCRSDLHTDPFIPLLTWWALESKIDADPDGVARILADSGTGSEVRNQVERFARRTLSDGRPESFAAYTRLVRVALSSPRSPDWVAGLIRGTEAALDATTANKDELAKLFREVRGKFSSVDETTILGILVRLGDPIVIGIVRRHLLEEEHTEDERVRYVKLAVREPTGEFANSYLTLLRNAKGDALRLALLSAIETNPQSVSAEPLIELYPTWPTTVKRKAISVLLSRSASTLEMLKAVDVGKLPKADLTLDHARTAVGLNDPAVTALVEKNFGKLAPATPGEKQARISWLTTVLNRDGLGDPAKGKALFAKHCAACHQLFGEGGKVGPDLTTADRKNRGYFLAQVVDPSGYIRPEYVQYKIDTLDGRAITGVVEPSAGESVTLVNVVDNQPQRTTVAKKDIDKMTPLSVSLMPEKLLDTLTEAEVRDLFAHLLADQPKAPVKQARSAAKKLRVALVSGSLEYKSDESLPVFQKHLEANYPVECVRMFRKTDTDIPGLEELEKCDGAIFFTRRLKIDGQQLDLVKKYVESGKPVVGIRTASHGFQNWLEMDKLVFGGDYKNHYGAGPACEVRIVEAARDHPVLRGVKPYRSSASLYKNPEPAKDITVLLTGTIPDHTEPVAWVRERKVGDKTQRVFYTSLGHPDDFRDPNFVRLVSNGLMWALVRGPK